MLPVSNFGDVVDDENLRTDEDFLSSHHKRYALAHLVGEYEGVDGLEVRAKHTPGAFSPVVAVAKAKDAKILSRLGHVWIVEAVRVELLVAEACRVAREDEVEAEEAATISTERRHALLAAILGQHLSNTHAHRLEGHAAVFGRFYAELGVDPMALCLDLRPRWRQPRKFDLSHYCLGILDEGVEEECLALVAVRHHMISFAAGVHNLR